MKKPVLRVVVRAGREPDEFSVVWRDPWTPTLPLTVWCRDGGHGGADYGWYYSRSRPATRAEIRKVIPTFRQIYHDFRVVVDRRLQPNPFLNK